MKRAIEFEIECHHVIPCGDGVTCTCLPLIKAHLKKFGADSDKPVVQSGVLARDKEADPAK